MWSELHLNLTFTWCLVRFWGHVPHIIPQELETAAVHPRQWVLDHYGAHDIGATNRVCLRQKLTEILGSPLPDIGGTLPEDLAQQPWLLEVSLTTFVPTRVVVGGVRDMPRLEQWKILFGDIVHANFDKHREPLKACVNVKVVLAETLLIGAWKSQRASHG